MTALEQLVETQTQLTQAIGALARMIRDSKASGSSRVNQFYEETARIAKAWLTSSGIQIRPEILTLQTALSTTTTSGKDNFSMPKQEDFVLLEMAGHIAVTDWPTDLAIDGPRTRLLVKANNCKFDFRLKDQSSRVYTANNTIPLSSIMPEAGGKAKLFSRDGTPMFLIPGSTLPEATFTLTDTTAPTVGGAANYGVQLTGVYVTREGGR